MEAPPPVVLTVAGSDPCGGAGIQADLKTFEAFGVYGAAVITAVTAQNTRLVSRVELVAPELVADQLDAVAGDLPVRALKTGMLGSAAIVRAVADRIRSWGLGERLIIDPVISSSSGTRLLDDDGVAALVRELLPLCAVVTPNLAEATLLSGLPIASDADAVQAAERIAASGARAVVITGGHRDGEPLDLLYANGCETWLRGERIRTTSTHGTGCAFSAALAAGLVQDAPVEEAARRAKEYVTGALRAARPLGGGAGPLAHAWSRRALAHA